MSESSKRILTRREALLLSATASTGPALPERIQQGKLQASSERVAARSRWVS